MSVVQISHLIKYALAARDNVYVSSNQSADVSLLPSSAQLYITGARSGRRGEISGHEGPGNMLLLSGARHPHTFPSCETGNDPIWLFPVNRGGSGGWERGSLHREQFREAGSRFGGAVKVDQWRFVFFCFFWSRDIPSVLHPGKRCNLFSYYCNPSFLYITIPAQPFPVLPKSTTVFWKQMSHKKKIHYSLTVKMLLRYSYRGLEETNRKNKQTVLSVVSYQLTPSLTGEWTMVEFHVHEGIFYTSGCNPIGCNGQKCQRKRPKPAGALKGAHRAPMAERLRMQRGNSARRKQLDCVTHSSCTLR